MKYTVTWVPDAEQELASLWVHAVDRAAVTDAANRIDQCLRFDPQAQGESRSQGKRVLLVPPLGIIFKVHPHDLVVQVLSVWHYA